MDEMELEDLVRLAKKVRYTIVKMIGACNAGHLGGSCSIADIVTALYYKKMRHS